MTIPQLGKKQWIFIGVFTAIATGAGGFWLTQNNPYLLENPVWQFNKPSDEAITRSLPSVRNMDYRLLRSLLESKQWEKADRETGRLLAKAIDSEIFIPMSEEDILSFPCTDLTTIDRLWHKASGGKFGFGVQSRIVAREEKSYNPEKFYQTCEQDCMSDKSKGTPTVFGCKERCFPELFSYNVSRIPLKMGRWETQQLKNDQAPEGYYPSWGVYWQTEIVSYPFYTYIYTYDNFAKRSSMCGL